jgi:hypothetical protein
MRPVRRLVRANSGSSHGAALVSFGIAVLGALLLASAAVSRDASGPALDVTFSAEGTISLTLPDGTPVGTTSGAPTVIPAGYYTLLLVGPGGCSELPYFELHGPGENILNDMDLGEMRATDTAYFLPNSTYTWRDNGIPGVVYTFTTSSTILGTPPATVSTRSSRPAPRAHSTTSSEDVVGSSIAPFRGRLSAVVAASGRLSVAFHGKGVSRLRAGRYTISVTDRSSTDGFALKTSRRKPVQVTGETFLGKRSMSVVLTVGKWLFVRRLGTTAYSILVR